MSLATGFFANRYHRLISEIESFEVAEKINFSKSISQNIVGQTAQKGKNISLIYTGCP